MMDTLIHIIADSGHSRVSARSEVRADVLEELRPRLEVALAALGSGAFPCGAGWKLSAVDGAEPDGSPRLDVKLWARGVPASGPASVVMAVVRPVDGGFPVLTASMAGVVNAPDPATAAMEAGNLERCIA